MLHKDEENARAQTCRMHHHFSSVARIVEQRVEHGIEKHVFCGSLGRGKESYIGRSHALRNLVNCEIDDWDSVGIGLYRVNII